MNIFVTGANGYIGRQIVKTLIKKGYSVKCLVRNASALRDMAGPNIQLIQGDVTVLSTLLAAMKGCDAVVHLVAIIKEDKRKYITFENINFNGTRNVVEAALTLGITRIIHLGALGSENSSLTRYFLTKKQAEDHVVASGLQFTIFRPSFVFGPEDEVYNMLAKIIRFSPFGLFPVFGNGKYLHQPIHVINIAEMVVDSLENPNTINKVYNAGGPDSLSYNSQLDILGAVLEKRVCKIHIPISLAKLIINIISLFPFAPIDNDRLKMLVLNNICDNSRLLTDIPLTLIPFSQGIKEYLV